MIAIIKRAIGPLVISLAATCSTAYAASAPTGVWLDHTGRGAVEITDCNGKLCGRIVWVKDTSHKEGCGFQVIGDVKPVAGGKWDGGWIIDPEKDPKHKYDVEITPQGDKLKVMGYAGIKFLSETMIWTRAPADLKRCSETAARAPDPAPAATPAPASTPPAPAPAPASAPKRSDGEPPTVYPPPPAAAAPAPGPVPAPAPAPAANPDPPKPGPRDAPTTAAKPGKDCKIELGSISFTFPCGE